ncbi:MAG TPA: heme NO-binding domain-containing protein [Acidimicrobiia bacterium]|nr:heme NO-binding domain-containing protein [Acidimicrobiia bacterium]
MKGVIFNLLEHVVTEAHGSDTWETLLDDTGLDGAWTSVGSYPDEDLLALVAAASARLDIPANDLVRWFGKSALPLLADRYAEFFEGHAGLASFLPTLNDVIHAEVRKLYPEAIVPTFAFVEANDTHVVMAYDSPRKMCALAEGFIEGAAEQFREKITIDQPECMLRGDARCLLVVDIAESHTTSGD